MMIGLNIVFLWSSRNIPIHCDARKPRWSIAARRICAPYSGSSAIRSSRAPFDISASRSMTHSRWPNRRARKGDRRLAGGQMVRRYVLVKVEGIKQSVLVAAVFSHHAGALPPPLLLTKTLKTQYRSMVFQRNRSGSDARHVYVTHRARISLT